MNLRISDISRISSRTCEEKYCTNKAYAIFHAKFLCKEHYREKKPQKLSNYRDGRYIRLSSKHGKEPFYMR